MSPRHDDVLWKTLKLIVVNYSMWWAELGDCFKFCIYFRTTGDGQYSISIQNCASHRNTRWPRYPLLYKKLSFPII